MKLLSLPNLHLQERQVLTFKFSELTSFYKVCLVLYCFCFLLDFTQFKAPKPLKQVTVCCCMSVIVASLKDFDKGMFSLINIH